MALKRNLHSIDIILRVIIGSALVYVGFIDASYIPNDAVRILLSILGIINLFAATMRFCPIYSLAGLSTYRSK
jgi:hypothetical protein